MTVDVLGPGALDYLLCQYGTSKLLFRGPKRALDGTYVAFLGGIQTYGKFIEQPYPLKVEHLTGVPSVNLGMPNAGVDVFARDQVVLKIARQARVTVVEVMGAANMNSRYYRVHSRRNDRFLGESPLLLQLFPEVDFTQFNFTHHMLGNLYAHDPERFTTLRVALQKIWVRRMQRMLRSLGGKIVLLWMEKNNPVDSWTGGIGKGPVFITRPLLAELHAEVSATVIVAATDATLAQGTSGMQFDALEESVAQTLLGPQAHVDVAQALLPILDDLM